MRMAATALALGSLLAGGQPLVAEDTAWMELDARATALYQAGEYAQAAAMTEEALRRAVSEFGPNHLNVAKYQHNLARIYALQHREAEAELLYQQALTIIERTQGPTHPQAASVLEGYAALKRATGHSAEAAALEAKLKKIRAADPAQRQRWEQLTAQVETFSKEGSYPQAAAAAKQAMALAEDIFGPSDLRVARSVSDLAELYRVLGKAADAAPLHQRALAIRQKALGPRHPDVALSHSTLGHLYKAQGKRAQAKAAYERALSIYEEALGPKDFAVANTLNSLAELAVEQGSFGSAVAHYKRVVEILEQTPDLASGELAMTLEKYAHCLRKLGKSREADQAAARAKTLQ